MAKQEIFEQRVRLFHLAPGGEDRWHRLNGDGAMRHSAWARGPGQAQALQMLHPDATLRQYFFDQFVVSVVVMIFNTLDAGSREDLRTINTGEMSDINGAAFQGDTTSGSVTDCILLGMDSRLLMAIAKPRNMRRSGQKPIVARNNNSVLLSPPGNNHAAYVQTLTTGSSGHQHGSRHKINVPTGAIRPCLGQLLQII